MVVRSDNVAPDFVQASTEGPIHFHDWVGDSWAVLFSYPGDFTPVCTTELGAAAKLKTEFDRHSVKIVGRSVDPPSHTPQPDLP
jgi:thioredoxin-dependent peroxiredoxin